MVLPLYSIRREVPNGWLSTLEPNLLSSVTYLPDSNCMAYASSLTESYDTLLYTHEHLMDTHITYYPFIIYSPPFFCFLAIDMLDY